MVALTRSRRTAFPSAVSPARYKLSASLKSASRKRESRCARAAMVSLKSLVSAMFPPWSAPVLSTFVVGPPVLGRRDRLPLTLLDASSEQNYETLAVPSEVDPVSGSVIHCPFEHS